MLHTQKKISIVSHLDNLVQIEQFVEEICDAYNINNNYFSNILIALNEAVKNAIVHGNKLDSTKTVNIKFETEPSGLKFVITDAGEGFDYRSTQDPTDPEIEFTGSGTGLFLIETLSDEVHFNEAGNSIELTFTTASINYELSVKRVDALAKYFRVSQKTLQV